MASNVQGKFLQILDEKTALALSSVIAVPMFVLIIFGCIIHIIVVTLCLPFTLVFEKFDNKQYHIVELNRNLYAERTNFIELKENESSLFTKRYASLYSQKDAEEWLLNNGYAIRRISVPVWQSGISTDKIFFTKGSPGSRNESVLIIFVASSIRNTNSHVRFSIFPFQYKEDAYNYPFDLSKFNPPKYPKGWSPNKTDVAFELGWYATDEDNTWFNDYYGVPSNYSFDPGNDSNNERESSCYGFLDL